MYGKIYQMVERYTKMLNVIHMLSDTVMEQDGHIINIRYDDLPMARVYLPKWDLTHDVILCPRKLLPTLFITQLDNTIELSNGTISVTLNLYQQVKLLISITKNTMNKLNIVILEPNIQMLFGDISYDTL
jgi:hypothetical protein